MIDRTFVPAKPARAIAVAVTLAASAALGGCNTGDISMASNAKANKPVPEKLITDMDTKNMDAQSPMLVRLFKQEAELEVWKQDRDGRFALLKTYPICRWSGDLGPKVREGDRQAPEGFYSIGPGQMNPQSSYYLSFNMGYPNAFDKALGRSGSQLMVHGDCSSRGCYAMTDEQISEIYALGRESFFGGQRAFQVQAYPFKMTPVNMAKHRNNPNMPFWKMIKQGWDHFEVSRQEPRVEFCENKYVFDPEPLPGGKPLSFVAGQKCPAYNVSADMADAVLEKQQADDARISELISRGTPVAARRPDIDGGMHRIFAAKLPDGSTGLSDAEGGGTGTFSRAPGTIPSTVNPPKSAVTASMSDDVTMSIAPVTTRVASATSSVSETSSGFFSNLAKRVGWGGDDDKTGDKSDKPKAAKSRAGESRVVAQKPVPVAPKVETRVTETKPVTAKPSPAAEAPAVAQGTTLAGAAPVMSSNSFESRFSATR